eukprot:SAG31_NODE_1676_length_7551_cov_1.951691_5_plen_219_part_00
MDRGYPRPKYAVHLQFAILLLCKTTAYMLFVLPCCLIVFDPIAALCLVYDFPTYFREDCIGVTIMAILVTNLIFGGTAASLIKMLKVPNARQDYPANQVRFCSASARSSLGASIFFIVKTSPKKKSQSSVLQLKMPKNSSWVLSLLRRVDLMCCQWWLIKKSKRHRAEPDDDPDNLSTYSSNNDNDDDGDESQGESPRMRFTNPLGAEDAQTKTSEQE